VDRPLRREPAMLRLGLRSEHDRGECFAKRNELQAVSASVIDDHLRRHDLLYLSSLFQVSVVKAFGVWRKIIRVLE